MIIKDNIKTYTMKPYILTPLVLLACTVLFLMPGTIGAEDTSLPVKPPDPKQYQKAATYGVDCYLDLDTLQSCFKDGGERGLLLDMTGIDKLLDGTIVKPGDWFLGTIYIGPYPFEGKETSYTYKRFRTSLIFQQSKAFIPVGYFLEGYRNSEDWSTHGQLAVRMKLYFQTEKDFFSLGLYDTFVRFKQVTGADGKKAYKKLTSLIDPPAVNMLTSDDASRMVITFKTDQPVTARVILLDGTKKVGEFSDSQPVKDHEIDVTGLKPDRDYSYRVAFEDYESDDYVFRSAPQKGQGETVFAYCGDSRAGVGEGTVNLMGVNYQTMERLANLAYNKGAQLFVFGGDLINGYTDSPGDFRTQMQGWWQAMTGFRQHRPVYSCIGNHEALVHAYRRINSRHPSPFWILDRWPYDTESTEALFAKKLVHPENGPETSDSRRPSYKENVYSFQYGPIRFISLNNNYWVARNQEKWESPWRTGGCPEGYIMPDQMEWLKQELDKANKDNTVKFIILYAQEPVFPNGGHTTDCMWYKGNNLVRAYTLDKESGKLKAEPLGILEVRNQFATMAAKYKKVAAVLGSDEHSYHKVLIHRDVPVLVPAIDHKDNPGQTWKPGDPASPLKELKYPVWYIVGGGGGAPYYSKEATPWNSYWESFDQEYPNHTSKRGCFYYSSQENVFIFKTKGPTLSLTVYNPYGEIIDTIDDLLKVKQNL